METKKSISKKSVRGHYSEVQRKASQKYKAKNIKNISISLSKIYDAELIEIYQSIPDKAGWFKSCLMEYKRRHSAQ